MLCDCGYVTCRLLLPPPPQRNPTVTRCLLSQILLSLVLCCLRRGGETVCLFQCPSLAYCSLTHWKACGHSWQRWLLSLRVESVAAQLSGGLPRHAFLLSVILSFCHIIVGGWEWGKGCFFFFISSGELSGGVCHCLPGSVGVSFISIGSFSFPLAWVDVPK